MVSELLKNKFTKPTTLKTIELDNPKNHDTPESLGFMCDSHARAISDCCRIHNVIVTFRAAGKNSIKRIKEGHPCKGHDILDKSIKQASATTWTYKGAGLEKFAGLIGHNIDGKSGTLDEIHYLKEDKKDRIVPIQITREIEKLCYTGDYDMHDLYYKSHRIVTDTPDEKSPIDYLNNAIFGADSSRAATHTAFVKKHPIVRTTQSPYALIRHGAQTMYIDYLLGEGVKKELKKLCDDAYDKSYQLIGGKYVAKIDGDLIAFTPDCKIYHLDSLAAVYEFYMRYKILTHVPFYNFFEMLKIGATDAQKKLIGAYSAKINLILQLHAESK